MEIRIDTKRDSDDEIRKAIRFLQSLIGESRTDNSSSSNIFNDNNDNNNVSSGMMGMFGDSPQTYSDDKKEDYDNNDDKSNDSPEIISTGDDDVQIIPY